MEKESNLDRKPLTRSQFMRLLASLENAWCSMPDGDDKKNYIDQIKNLRGEVKLSEEENSGIRFWEKEGVPQAEFFGKEPLGFRTKKAA